jgi:hypothetical protein
MRYLDRFTNRRTEMYAYNADLYCDACGKAIIEELEREGIEDEGDSDQFPQWVDEDYSETDCPSHCGNGPDCLYAIELPSGHRVGYHILESLTTYGRDYVTQAIAEGGEVATTVWAKAYPDCVPRLCTPIVYPKARTTNRRVAMSQTHALPIPFKVPNLDCGASPEILKATSDVLARLAEYARMKAKAMQFREAGRIDVALKAESRCDWLYRQLPETHRW